MTQSDVIVIGAPVQPVRSSGTPLRHVVGLISIGAASFIAFSSTL